MKKVVLAALVVAMVASASNAAILSMRWAGTSEKTITLAPSDTAVLEVVFTMQAFDKKASGAILTDMENRFNGIPGDPKAIVTGITTALSGGSTAASTGVGGPLEQFFMGLNGVIINANGTQFSTVVAAITIHCAGATGGPVAIAFNGTAPLPGVHNGATDWTNDYPVAPTVSKHFTMGTGAPGSYDQYGVLVPGSADPLYLIQTPEPAALALLALGGLALLRRK